MQTTLPSKPRACERQLRIPLDRRNLQALLGKVERVGDYLLYVETDTRGETVAYLQRRPATARWLPV